MNEPIHTMNIFDLLREITQKEKEYKEAIKSEKEFWEVQQLFKRKKELKEELRKKVSNLIIAPTLV